VSVEAADLDLIARLREGDTSALDELMARYSGQVFRLAYGVTRNAADAEEVVQDVFLRAFQKISGFEGRAALSTWLYRVTTNAALNRRRGKARQVEVSLDELLPAFKPDGHRQGERSFVLADWSATPENELLSSEGRAMLAEALDALPASYRAVLVLRDVEGLSNEAVAEMLEESLGSVKSRLHRARMALREHLTRRWWAAEGQPTSSAAPA
jgi:RNA polymerase sigma-70 factor (ECF subfamily)